MASGSIESLKCASKGVNRQSTCWRATEGLSSTENYRRIAKLLPHQNAGGTKKRVSMEVIDWLGASDRRSVAQRAAEALVRGDVVAFPTDTVYGVAASAQSPAAIEQLSKLRNSDEPL